MLALALFLACKKPPETAAPLLMDTPEWAVGPSRALANAGLQVQLEPVVLAMDGWSPEMQGMRFKISDASRNIEWTPPYTDLPPTSVHPTLVLDLYPLAAMHTDRDLTARDTPSVVVGATATFVALAPVYMGSPDETLSELAENTLLGPADAGRGLSGFAGDSAEPHDVPPPAPGRFATLWTWTDGGHQVEALVVP